MFIPFRKWVLACVFVIATIATARLAGEEEEVARRQLQIEKEEETERLLLTMEEAQDRDSIEVRRFSNNGRYLRQIWNDGGSGADLDVSIWRAKDWKDREGNRWFSLGDIAVSGYGAPASFYLMRAKPGINLEEVFASTRLYYDRRWTDKHTGAYLDCALFIPRCPPGSYPLGHIAAKNGFLSGTPNHTYTCIKAKYTEITSVPRKILWHDKGSGAWHDVTLMAAGIRPGVSANGGIFTICLNDWKNCVADAHEIDWTDDSRRLRSFGGPNFHD